MKAFTSETQVYDGVLAGGALDRCGPADRHHQGYPPGTATTPGSATTASSTTTPDIADQGGRPMIAHGIMGIPP